jgi:peptidylprolyl isomerase
MITPARVVIVAALLGIAGAVFIWMQGPQAAPQEQSAASSSGGAAAAPTSEPAPLTAAAGTRRTTASGLTIIDVVVGTGPAAKDGDNISVQYTGRLESNGKKFDSSYDRNEPFSFVLGQGQVIKGWDEGVADMKVGGKRQLIIPPELGYGAGGTPDGSIPPNAALVFDVELVKIQ